MSGNYIVPSTTPNNNDRVSIPASSVIPVFREVNTAIDYDDIEITSLINTTTVTVGQTASVVVNSIPVCTRYQVNGDRVLIHNLVFDQSKPLNNASPTPLFPDQR